MSFVRCSFPEYFLKCFGILAPKLHLNTLLNVPILTCDTYWVFLLSCLVAMVKQNAVSFTKILPKVRKMDVSKVSSRFPSCTRLALFCLQFQEKKTLKTSILNLVQCSDKSSVYSLLSLLLVFFLHWHTSYWIKAFFIRDPIILTYW